MKFLVFNMVVAAALFYLFAGETADFRQLVKKADTNITKLKNGITELVPDESSDAPVQEKVKKAPRQTEAPVVGAKTQKLPAAKMVKRSPEQKSQVAFLGIRRKRPSEFFQLNLCSCCSRARTESDRT